MFYKWIRPFLFLFNPETIHEILVWLLSLPPSVMILNFLFRNRDLDSGLEKTVFGVYFKNPIGLAGGFDKNGKALLAWQAMGFGFVEVGTVTPKPQRGNLKPRILRLSKEQALVNWLGFNNHGIDVVIKRIEAIKPKLHIPIGLNIGKNADTSLENAYQDYVTCIQKGNEWVDFFVINVSSPNTMGLRDLQNPHFLDLLLENVMNVATKPVLLKLSPDLSVEELRSVMSVCEHKHVSGLIVSNTSVQYSLVRSQPFTKGGMSGRPIFKISTDLIKTIRSQSQLPMIGVGGIFSGEDAIEKLTAGASLVEVFTGLIYEGPGLIYRLKLNLISQLNR